MHQHGNSFIREGSLVYKSTNNDKVPRHFVYLDAIRLTFHWNYYFLDFLAQLVTSTNALI